MAYIAVIADDITGANDTGIQFKKNGLESVVILSDEYTKYSDVLIMDSDSRRDQREQVEKKVTQVITLLKGYNPKYWYKKIDSTLRGKIGLEIELMFNLIKSPFAMVCPAYPATNREVVGGQLLVKGVPIAETELANDVLTPVRFNSVREIIEEDSNLKCGELTLEDYAFGLEHCLDKIQGYLKNGEKVIIFDCEKEKDFDLIGQIIDCFRNEAPLVVGSAGLAEIVAKLWSGKKIVDNKNVLVIAGSVSDTTAHQVAVAAKEKNIIVIDLDFYKVFSDSRKEYIKEIEQIVIEKFSEGLDVIIRSSPDKSYVSLAREIGFQLKGLTQEEVSANIAEFFSEVVNNVLTEYRKLTRLFLTGGDVAIRICKKLEALGLKLIEEIEPGIPISQIIGGKYEGVYVITKAGAFGSNNAIINAIKRLKEY